MWKVVRYHGVYESVSLSVGIVTIVVLFLMAESDCLLVWRRRLSVVSLQVWCWDAMFRNTVECDIVSMRVSEIIVPPGNSLIFPVDGPCDMLSTGHAPWFRYSRWATPDSDVV